MNLRNITLSALSILVLNCISLDFIKANITPVNNLETFNKLVLTSKEPVIVKFYGPWCPPCKRLKPELEKVSKEYNGKVKFFEVNIDTASDITNKYNIRSVPVLLFLSNGKEAGRTVGFTSASQIKKYINQYLKVK